MSEQLAVQTSTPVKPTITHASRGLVQRQCACGQHSGGGGECEACKKQREGKLQRAAINTAPVTQAPPIVHEVLRSPGQPLDNSARSFFETRFAHEYTTIPMSAVANTVAASSLAVGSPTDPLEVDAERTAARIMQGAPPTNPSSAPVNFGMVRIHSDERAAASALAIGARAYTVGQHMVFAPGQYQPQDERGRQLLAHELAHVTQNATNPQAQRLVWQKKFETNEDKCTATLRYKVQLLFKDSGTDKWDKARKDTFRSQFKQSIEDTFNGNSYGIKPNVSSYQSGLVFKDTKTCPCATKGFRPIVGIDLVPDDEWSTSEDWEADVFANASGKDIRSETNTSYGTLDEADTTAVTKKSSAPGVKQKPAVHEFGHSIGLDHPGAGLDKAKLAPGATEYSHTGTDVKGRAVNGPTDLMGGGMGLRPFYFDNWRDQLNDKYGSGCGWTTQ